MINGKQITVTWHVGDLKVSHKDDFEIAKFVTYLSGIYGKKLTLHIEKVHENQDMELDHA